MSGHGFDFTEPSRRYGFLNPEVISDPITIRKYLQEKRISIPYHCDVARVKACNIKTQDFIRNGYSLTDMVAFGFNWNDLLEMGLEKVDFYDGWFDTKTIAQQLRPTPNIIEAFRSTLHITATDLLTLYNDVEDFQNLGITMAHLIMPFGITVDQFMSLEMTLEELCRHLSFTAKDIRALGLNHYQMSALWLTRDWTPENLRVHCRFGERDRQIMTECETLRTTTIIENIQL